MNHVLCIDDDVVAQRLYSILLKNAGYEVVNATSASMAIEKIEQQRYAAAILDYMIPDLNGLDLAGRIRRHADESIRKLPLIVCSASLDRKAVQQFTILGVRHFLVKPIEKELLKQTLIRASGTQWDGKAITSLELICCNLGVDSTTALELLQDAAAQLRTQYAQLREATAVKEEAAVKMRCSALRSTLGNLGLRSDDEWMMDVRGLVTAVEAGLGSSPSDLESLLARMEGAFDRLHGDLAKLSGPPSASAPVEAKADVVPSGATSST